MAAGFDASGAYLLTISHSGRAIFSTSSWERRARDYTFAYPEGGSGVGIGPIAGQIVPVTGMDYEKGAMRLTSRDGRITLNCESSGISVEVSDV